MKKFYYYSNSGCVKIGNKDFNVMLLNGKGEGSFWIELCDKNEEHHKDKNCFISKIAGSDINIYESDDGENPFIKLKNGEYAVFHKNGNILVQSI